MSDKFYQMMFLSEGFMDVGPFFRTYERGLEALKANAKERSKTIYSPFRAILVEHQFEVNQTQLVYVAEQRKTGGKRYKVVELPSAPSIKK